MADRSTSATWWGVVVAALLLAACGGGISRPSQIPASSAPGDAVGADPMTARPGDIIVLGGCAEPFTLVELWAQGEDGPTWELVWWFDNTTSERGDWPSDRVPEFSELRCVNEIHEFEIPSEAVPGWYRVDARAFQVLAQT